MAKPPTAPIKKVPANLSLEQIRVALPKLKRRHSEIESIKIPIPSEISNEASRVVHKIEATLLDVFGPDTVEFHNYTVPVSSFFLMFAGLGTSDPERIEQFRRGLSRACSNLKTAIEVLEEKLGDEVPDAAGQTLRAYDGLKLHTAIAEAATDLYHDGHYAHAVQDAVKALNNLVRLKSGEEGDGTSLMERVFSPKSPILRFNDLANQSDQDEQKGFMQLFSGAVSGIRNPRAHEFINDDPERALEFIAFVSLLAKLLDSAKKQRPITK